MHTDKILKLPSSSRRNKEHNGHRRTAVQLKTANSKHALNRSAIPVTFSSRTHRLRLRRSQHHHVISSTLSYLVGNCELEDIEPNKEETYIQLMQLSDYNKITTIQCEVEVDRIISLQNAFPYFHRSQWPKRVYSKNRRKNYLPKTGRNCKTPYQSPMLSIARNNRLTERKSLWQVQHPLTEDAPAYSTPTTTAHGKISSSKLF